MRALAVVATGLLLLVSDAAAQDQRRDVTGVVLDAATGAPLASVAVGVDDQGTVVYTNAAGAFVLPGVSGDTAIVRARLLGYQTGSARSLAPAPGEEPSPLRIALAPDPVLLGSIQVVVDRFETRRRAAPYMIRAYTLDALAQSAAYDITNFVRENAILSDCPSGSGLCVYSRGRYSRPRVYLNDAPLPGGLDALRGWPKDDFYRVEIGRPGGGLEVYAYTKWFIERITR